MNKKNLFLSLLLLCIPCMHAQDKHVIGAYYRLLSNGKKYKAGMFSALIAVLTNLEWAKKNGKIPVIHWDEDSAYFQPGGYRGFTNVWDYYFERVSDESYDPLTDTKWYSYADPDGKGIMPFQEYPLPFRISMYHLIKEYVHIKPHILEQIAYVYDQYFKDRIVIGVHLRGTDKSWEFDQPSPEYLIAVANELADQIGDCQFFVATDEEKLLDLAKKTLKRHVIYCNSYRSKDECPLHFLPAGHGKARLGEEAIIETKLLSLCQALVYSDSNMAHMATFWNPTLKTLFVRGIQRKE